MRKLLAGLATAAIAMVGGAVFLSQGLAQRSPEAIASMNPLDNSAQRLAAAKAVKDNDQSDAAFFAKRAVAAMPLDQFGLATSSSAREPAEQLAILNLAAALGWRDGPTNLALIERGLSEGRPDIAAQRIDATGRIFGAEPLLELTDRLLLVEGGLRELGIRAKARNDGAWWQGYFRSAPKSRSIGEARAALLASIDPEDGAWRRQMVQDAAIGFAAAGMEELLIPASRSISGAVTHKGSLIFDSGFKAFDPGTAGLTGEWVYPNAAPAVLAKTASGNLLIEPTGAGAGAVLSQKFIAKAGAWTLRARGEAGDGFAWQITCQSSGKLELGELATVAIGESVFTIPEQCRVAELSLVAKAGAAAPVRLDMVEISEP